MQIDGEQVTIQDMVITGTLEPRLRFDKTAVGLVDRLQRALAQSVPTGKTVVVTVAAPIRQDSKTTKALEVKIHELLATRKTRLETTLLGNRIQVRILKGGNSRTMRLIGFVHNPEPRPTMLFEVTRTLLRCIDSEAHRKGSQPALIIRNENGRAPIETIRQICAALCAPAVFRGIFVVESNGVKALCPAPQPSAVEPTMTDGKASNPVL